MAKRRLSDTEALTSAAPPCGPSPDCGESVSVHSRQISNGWLTSRSHSSEKGYHHEETFSKSKPNLAAPSSSRAAPEHGGALGSAVKYLKE